MTALYHQVDPAICRLVFDLLAESQSTNWDNFAAEAAKHLGSVSNRDIILSILGHLPPDESKLRVLPKHELLAWLLKHPYFQSNVISRILTAYRDLSVFFFLHIPKTAGTFITTTLSGLYPTLTPFDQMKGWTSTEKLFEILKIKIKHSKEISTILVAGHIPLNQALREGYFTHGIKIFTVYRDPIEVYFSHADFVLTSIIEDPKLQKPHTNRWAKALSLDSHDIANLKEDCKISENTYIKALNIRQGNIICEHLGNGKSDNAYHLARSAGVEFVHIDSIKNYMNERFGIEKFANDSKNEALRFRELFIEQEKFKKYANQRNLEDLKLYAVLEEIRKNDTNGWFFIQ